jgi:hypothetical protein
VKAQDFLTIIAQVEAQLGSSALLFATSRRTAFIFAAAEFARECINMLAAVRFSNFSSSIAERMRSELS